MDMGIDSNVIELINGDSVRKEKEVVPILGRKFGKLTPYEKVYGRYKKDNKTIILYKCHCDCGNDILVRKYKLLHGSNLDCGCVQKAKFKKFTKKTNVERKQFCSKPKDMNKKYPRKGRIYNIWQRMKTRCHGTGGQNTIRYYAGRGIKYQESWEKFENFYDDMKDGYADGLQLDRINSNGDYTKENCRWITAKENCRNRRDNTIVTAGGETHVQAWWMEKYGLSSSSSLPKRLQRDYGDDWEIVHGHRQNWLPTPRYHI